VKSAIFPSLTGLKLFQSNKESGMRVEPPTKIVKAESKKNLGVNMT
jgi:hypothetical protein